MYVFNLMVLWFYEIFKSHETVLKSKRHNLVSFTHPYKHTHTHILLLHTHVHIHTTPTDSRFSLFQKADSLTCAQMFTYASLFLSLSLSVSLSLSLCCHSLWSIWSNRHFILSPVQLSQLRSCLQCIQQGTARSTPKCKKIV